MSEITPRFKKGKCFPFISGRGLTYSKVRLGNLRSQNHGSVLLVRAIEQSIQLGPLFPVMNVVEDITHDVSHLEVFFPSTSPPTAILKQGTVVAIKEPYELH